MTSHYIRKKMLKKLIIFTLMCLTSLNTYANSIEILKEKINNILESKQATVGVSIHGSDAEPILSINGDIRIPMQSVFKYHLAVAALHQVDQGLWSLEDQITITPEDLDNGLWSPIRKKYPKGTRLTLSEVIKYTVAVSDNTGCDILIRMLGGPKVIEKYFHQLGINNIAIKYNEVTMQEVWQRQYQNWTTANAANRALSKFYNNENKLLTSDSHQFLWDVMKSAKTGQKTIRAGVPKGAVVAHKTGHSGKNDKGVTAAQNDIGIVFLADGNFYYLSVLVSDSVETAEVNKKIISDISNLTWHFFTKDVFVE